MNIAILGFESLGRKLYEILIAKKSEIYRNYDLNIKYILVNEIPDIALLPNNATTDFKNIINDNDIDLIIDVLNNDKSFEYIKEALYSSKHVITTNFDVIASHYVELQAIAIDMNVKLLFDGAVGGGMSIINNLLMSSTYNEITKIEAIFDDDINNLLTLMSKYNLSFNQALDNISLTLDKQLDFEGKIQAKKLQILSMIAYNTTINYDDIYRYSISNIDSDIILVSSLLGYKAKYIASSYFNQSYINMTVEPVLVKNTDIFASTENRYGIIRYYGIYSDAVAFYGKNDGDVIANAIIIDIKRVLSDYRQKFMPRYSHIVSGNRHLVSRYLIKPKVMNDFFKNIAEKNLDNIIVSSPISGDEILEHKNEIQFYARIID